jgi:hypothetical protein
MPYFSQTRGTYVFSDDERIVLIRTQETASSSNIEEAVLFDGYLVSGYSERFTAGELWHSNISIASGGEVKHLKDPDSIKKLLDPLEGMSIEELLCLANQKLE